MMGFFITLLVVCSSLVVLVVDPILLYMHMKPEKCKQVSTEIDPTTTPPVDLDDYMTLLSVQLKRDSTQPLSNGTFKYTILRYGNPTLITTDLVYCD
jgi:hypothetical protein